MFTIQRASFFFSLMMFQRLKNKCGIADTVALDGKSPWQVRVEN